MSPVYHKALIPVCSHKYQKIFSNKQNEKSFSFMASTVTKVKQGTEKIEKFDYFENHETFTKPESPISGPASGIYPSHLKLQIGGTIDLPAYSDTEQKYGATPKHGHAFHVLRRPNNTVADHKSYEDYVDGSPATLDSVKTSSVKTKVAEYSEEKNEEDIDEADASRGGSSKENSASSGDSKPLVKKVIAASKTDILHDKEANSDMHKSTPLREVNQIHEEDSNELNETSHDSELKIPKPVFMNVDPQLRIVTTIRTTTKQKPHKVQDDEKIRTFSAHVFKQALNAFESMKKKADQYTQQKIDSLAETYKEKFTDFVQRTRDTRIKTSQGTQNAILHTIDTSNLIMERIVNYLKTDMLGSGTSALRQGGASRLQKEVDTLKATEFEHACKMFGICRSAQGFRNELQDIISTLLFLPDDKLLQINDAVTEILKNADLAAFTHSNPIQDRIKKALRAQERTDAATFRSDLQILFGVLSKSHQPLIVDKDNGFEIPAVRRTVAFHSFLDALEVALPATEANRKEWALIKNKLKRFKDGANVDVQETLDALFHNINNGVVKFGTGSGKIRELVKDIVKSVDDDEE